MQTAIDKNRVLQLDHLFLEGRALTFVFDFPRADALLPNHRQEGFELVKRVVAQPRFLEAFILQLQLRQKVRMMNEENGTVVSLLGAEHYFQQPFAGFEFLRMVPEFPGRNHFERHISSAANLQQ